jgi:hypothetical protein
MRRSMLVCLQIAAVIIFLASALHLATLLAVFGSALDEIAKAAGDNAGTERTGALIGLAWLVSKDILTLVVAGAAFRYASQKRRGSQDPK